ncbi:MAG: ABC transporter transmembrane domain-containing protein, partial [Tissierellia bacterium]|nr:ABC transporter transmembrane domain-containing protein [Tissierellia bacterium]
MKAIIGYIKMALSLLGKYKKDVQKGYIAAFFESGFTFVPYMLLFYIISVSLTREILPKDVYIVSIAMIVSVVLRTFCKKKQDELQQNRGLYALTEKRLEITDHLSKLNMGYYDESNIGNISAVVTGDLSFMEEMVYVQLGLAVSAIASWIISIIYIFVFNFKLGILYLLCSLIGLLALKLMNSAMAYGVYRRQENFGIISQSVLDFIQGLPTIKAFNMMKEKNTDIDSVIKKVEDDAVDHVNATLIKLQLYRIFNHVLTGIFAFGVCYFLQKGEVELPWAIGFIVFSFILFTPIQ